VDPQIRYGSRIPIGKAISNTSLYLLDDDLNPVPEGVPGEICVAGVSLALGYLDRDDLTAEKFVANPFVGGERLYKTGDLGVWLPGGNLELIGRKDNQVKIRGYRIEIGEIEATLLQHPEVEETVVVAREDPFGNKRLIAYVAGRGPIESAGLRALLKARLPEFMMPSAFVVMDKMPLTANGKIDRKALPDPDAPGFRNTASSDVPQNETQEVLARIWQDVLGIGRVGINDNLFEIGGDSILVIQIVSRARQAGIKLAPAQLFERQTIAELSRIALPVRPPAGVNEHIDGAAPLTAAQEWFFEMDIAERHHFNQSVMLEIKPGLDAAIAEEATRKLLQHHDALRLRFFQSNGRWVAEHSPMPDAAPFSVVDVSRLSPDDQDEAILASASDLQARFDLSSGPLIHVRLFLLGSGRAARILFVAHHLVIDGVSWRVLLEDFYAVCSGTDLPRKTTSYRTWATRLREEARSVAEHDYWRSSRRLQVKPIPVDYAYGAHENTVDTAREATIELDEAVTAALLHEAPKAYNTEINDLLLTALARTLVEWTGQETMLIDLEGHGREDLFEDLDTSRTVGWLTTLFPVLLDMHRDAAPGEALKSVKEQLRAVPRRGIGYGMLRYLSDDKALINALKAFPKADVLFNYLGQTGRVLAQGLSWVPILGLNGPEQSPRSKRPHLLEISAIVMNDRLKVSWTFSEKVHSKSTIDNVVRRYETTLRGLIQHCTTAETRQYTPSDFPAARLDQKSLDALIARIKI
jgi:non-ribosomal peptide synthase protein (TIGR01720 family)